MKPPIASNAAVTRSAVPVPTSAVPVPTSAVMDTYARFPITLVRGRGVWVWDSQGRRYLDAVAGIAVCTLGHSDRTLARSLSRQLRQLQHVSNLYRIPEQEQLAAAITPRTRAIVTISPNNPSGAVLPPPVLAAINRLCAQRGLLHICDEAYALFGHGETPVWSPGSQPASGSHTITLGSLSKSHGMAGWRVGWAVVPEALVPELAKVQDTILICPPRLIQRVAIAALQAGPDWCRQQIAGLGERRRLVLSQLQPAGDAPWQVLGPADGAFYVLLRLACNRHPDAVMAELIRRHGLALVSGSSFGLPGCHLRLSYGMLESSALVEALRRLVAGLWQICET